MDVTITINLTVSDADVLASIMSILDNTLPYMGDNVEIVTETEGN